MLQQGDITDRLLVTTEEVFVHDITFTFDEGTVAYYTLSDFFLDWRHCHLYDPWHDVPTDAPTQDPVSTHRKKRAREGGDTEGPPRKVPRQETTPVRSCYAPLHCTVTHA